MARQLGAHVEYSTLNADGERIERVFSSELNALRSAVKNQNAVVYVEYGETIGEALKREAAHAATIPAGGNPPAARSKPNSGKAFVTPPEGVAI